MLFHPNPTQMLNLFHRTLSFVMRHPRAFAFLLFVLVVSAPNVAEAQRCYSSGYGSSCETYDNEWLDEFLALILLWLMPIGGWASWV